MLININPLNKSFVLSSSDFLDGASGGVALVKEILNPSISTYSPHSGDF